MATIRTAIALYDGVTSPLQSMTKAMNTATRSFEAMETASSHAVDSRAIVQGRKELVETESIFEGIQDSIRQSDQAQQRFNGSLQGGSSAAQSLWSKIKGIAAAVGGMMAVEKVLGLSDQMAGTKARLSLVVDDGDSVSELEDKIMASAERSRAAYFDVANTVAKLGLLARDSFTTNDEMIQFAELMSKNFVIAGAAAEAQSSAMYQINQALASGRLQGDEYRAVIENAPLLAQAIEQYMRDAGVSGTMKDWAADGLLTAEVIKTALFSSTDEVEARFAEMPLTWEDVLTSMKNRALAAFDPILEKINSVLNTGSFSSMIDDIINGVSGIANVAIPLLDALVFAAAGIYENWSWIAPVILGVVGAILFYQGAMLLLNIANAIHNTLDAVAIAQTQLKAGATLLAAAATKNAEGAQIGLNAALLACPVFWIVLGIIALIAIFYAAVAAVNHFAGTTYSATGAICGAVMWLLSAVSNVFIALWNVCVDVFVLIYNLVADVVNFIGTAFEDPIGAAARLFFDFADTVLGVMETVASALDTIFGFNLSGAVQGWRSDLEGWVNKTFGEGTELVVKLNPEDQKLDRLVNADAFDMGYKFGQGVEDKVSGWFKSDEKGDQWPLDGAQDFGADGFGNAMDGIYVNTGDTAESTAAMADAMELSQEDMSLLRDIAEREAINRFTTAEIKVDMINNNSLATNMDLDGMVNVLESKVTQALLGSAEGVHV